MAIIHLLPEIDIARRVAAKGKPGRRGKTTVPAEHVLDIRRRHEILGQSLGQIQAAYPQYGDAYLRAVLWYPVRANLRVKPI